MLVLNSLWEGPNIIIITIIINSPLITKICKNLSRISKIVLIKIKIIITKIIWINNLKIIKTTKVYTKINSNSSISLLMPKVNTLKTHKITKIIQIILINSHNYNNNHNIKTHKSQGSVKNLALKNKIELIKKWTQIHSPTSLLM